MDFVSVDQYLNKLHYADLYKSLDNNSKQTAVFEAMEMLKDRYRESLLSERIVAIQTLYMLEGEDEDFRKFRRQGVTAIRSSDLDVTFEGRGGQSSVYDPISPEVQQMIRSKCPPIGELI